MSLTGSIKQNLREKLIKSKEKKGKASDPRYLNYYDLPEDTSMKILLLPCGSDSGDLFVTYSRHGTDIKGVDPINCAYTSSGESCPACALSYESYKAKDEVNQKAWRNKETHLFQGIVLESQIEISQAPDGNMVKLINMPFKVYEYIENQIIDGVIEDPTEVVLVLKKTKNSGGQNSYDKSYFDRGNFDIEKYPQVVEWLEGDKVVPYDLQKEVPVPTTAAHVEEWMVKAEKALSGRTDTTETGGEDKGKDDTVRATKVETKTVDSTTTGGSLKERLEAARRKAGNA